MISLPRLNKLLLFIIFFVLLNINFVYAEDKAEDIWDSENENIQEKNSETNEQKEIKIEGSTISSDVEKIIMRVIYLFLLSRYAQIQNFLMEFMDYFTDLMENVIATKTQRHEGAIMNNY